MFLKIRCKLLDKKFLYLQTKFIKLKVMEEKRKYFKRDISWLSFNYRVMKEAMNHELPLYDRIKFLSIYSSNQEEFYRVRVSEYHQTLAQKDASPEEITAATATLQEINKEVGRQLKDFNHIFFNDIIPELKKENIVLYQEKNILENHKSVIRNYFKEEVFPYLQPVLILKNDIVSFLRDNRLYIAIKLYKKGDNTRQPYYAQIKIPFSKVPRFIELPPQDEKYYLIFIDDIISLNLDIIFPGFIVDSHYEIRVSRNADFSIETKDGGNLVDEVRKRVKKRKIGNANRLVYDARMPKDMLQFLCDAYNMPGSQCLPMGPYLTLEDLSRLPNPTGKRLTGISPAPLHIKTFDKSKQMFDVIDKQDVFIHFPYQSFDYLTRFLDEAANNPDVAEIKLTQYRVAENSAIINELIKAARNQKKVTVYVEIKARFDEENNIITSELLQDSGIRVVYSTPGLKVHAKAILVRLRPSAENENSRNYVFLSTGNFNEDTARIYSDMGIFTSNERIATDLNNLFCILDGSLSHCRFDNLLVAQFNMLTELKAKIAYETEQAKMGKRAHIILKMNGLQDTEMINALYDASIAGVKIDLIVRGINCLVPNQPYSKNIRIIRIIDSYLEHARVWYFYGGGKEEVYISSADWMKRNLNRRIETALPILDSLIKRTIINILTLQLQDNTQACLVDENLNNNYICTSGEKIRSQRRTYDLIEQISSDDEREHIPNYFIC